MTIFLQNLQIRVRLMIIVGLAIIGVVVLTVCSLMSLRSAMLDERSAKLLSIVDGAVGVVKYYHQLQLDGTLTEAQAKKQTVDTLNQFRYEKDNYLYIYDNDYVRIMLPGAPEKIGKSFKDVQGKDGHYLVRELVDLASSKGQGFVNYNFQRPPTAGSASQESEPVPKLAYVTYFKDWGWTIGTGVYMDDLNDQFRSIALISIGIDATILVLIGLISFFISRSILSQLGGEPVYAVEVVTQVAQGNLTMRANLIDNDHSSVLAKLQMMVGELRKLMINVRTASESIDMAATEIAQGNLDLSARTESQSASLEETASSMNELTTTVRQNSESARQASKLADTASEVALHGGTVVRSVVETMDSIQQSSRKIVDIISVIDGIAFQTNILALNAAVEAARAGEQGRGFAVVASEVRTLAQRSASAAREIKELIQDSVSKIESGAIQVNDAGTATTKIVDSIKHVTDIMAEIALASSEQTQGIEQVNTAIVEMESITQQNAALVEQAAAAAQSMQDQARSLVDSVNTFRV